MQYDLHPEKEVYGLKGPSGLGFYFWTQSFGRIMGDNPFDNHTPWYFLLQTMLWDFQPWIVLFIPSIWYRLKSCWTGPSSGQAPEYISFSGFTLPFIVLSFSTYKLPHYIFPLFPLAAVMVADYALRMAGQLPKWLEAVQLGMVHLLLLSSLLVMFWVFRVTAMWLPLLWVFFIIALWWTRKHVMDATDRWILPSVVGVIGFQLILTLHFYPGLLSYQSSTRAGKYIAAHHPARVYWHDRYGYALDYCSNRVIPNAYGPSVDTLSPGTWIWVSGEALPTMPSHNVLQSYDDFRVSRLNKKFLDPKTRPGKLDKMYLIEVRGEE
jgi:4-amino-4-deoxy-L-arabinose transferase-like glycosyltransferase